MEQPSGLGALGASLLRGCLRASSGFVSWQQRQPQRLLGQALVLGGPFTALWLPQVHGSSGSRAVEVASSPCSVGPHSQGLVVSLQSPCMAEAGLRLFPARLFSCSFQQMLRGEGWSLFLLPAGLVLPKLGSSFPGFGTAGESNGLDLPWSCSGLLVLCSGLLSPCPKAEQFQAPGMCPWKSLNRWNS